MTTALRAPFPWFGGKRRVAHLVWKRFGDVPNYVEPFAGSLAVLLARPHQPKIETVNDRDAYLVNFWRAVQAEPDAVWAWADQPVIEADLHARHLWLLQQHDFRERMLTDPHFYDVKIAGWWVWGLSLWIGDGWCAACNSTGRPHRCLPELATDRGVRRRSLRASARCRATASRSRPRGAFDDLAERLRSVRIVCGDWSRVVTPSVTWRHGLTAVFLDPPYDAREHDVRHAGGTGSISAAVRAWAIENGDNPQLRIALCGYEGEHEMPDTWECVAWKAQGGYGSQGNGRGRANRFRERIWFSPACLRVGLPLEATA